jgi:hypothetical protein
MESGRGLLSCRKGLVARTAWKSGYSSRNVSDGITRICHNQDVLVIGSLCLRTSAVGQFFCFSFRVPSCPFAVPFTLLVFFAPFLDPTPPWGRRSRLFFSIHLTGCSWLSPGVLLSWNSSPLPCRNCEHLTKWPNVRDRRRAGCRQVDGQLAVSNV